VAPTLAEMLPAKLASPTGQLPAATLREHDAEAADFARTLEAAADKPPAESREQPA
jgi:hypothetical protein